MKKLFYLFIIFVFNLGFSQESNLKEYSYSEFFKKIANEKDSIFILKDALIKFNPNTDSRFKTKKESNEERDSLYKHRNDIVIDKSIELDNVHFSFSLTSDRYENGVLLDIYFKKNVVLKDVATIKFKYCRFDGAFTHRLTDCNLENILPSMYYNTTLIEYSNFNNRYSSFFNCLENQGKVTLMLKGNYFTTSDEQRTFLLYNNGIQAFVFDNNLISNKKGIILNSSGTTLGVRISDNIFRSDFISFRSKNQTGFFEFKKNSFSSTVYLEIDPFSLGDKIDWKQFEYGIGSDNAFSDYLLRTVNTKSTSQITSIQRENFGKKYKDSVRYYHENSFDEEISLKSLFYGYFKDRHNTKLANQVYLELKDFETKRLQIEYTLNPTFKTYFTWKTNQFLKVFSAYGTEPARAIIYSMYVILIFALVYLFFPNSWDSHGKNRIIDRYNFFFKYMKLNTGVHEVYLDDQKEELMSYEQFKENINNSNQKVPRFFTATALPLYKWAISGTQFSASILKRIDIMKGTWSELPKSKQIWKSILLISAFLVAILYDITIKILNALMLSINTFTTLGFGEIPIKGLPRYLAIIQGFIGWFMLTIFSVSLISQLLN